MPIVPTCTYPGCFRPKPCTKHRRRLSDATRGNARQRGYTSDWDTYSRWFIRQAGCSSCGRNHVLCERCQAEGRTELSELTDHIIPIQSADDPKFWDHANHQGLSRKCHAIKTAEDRAKGLTR